MKELLTEQGSGEALDNHWTWKDTTSHFDFFPSISIYSCLRVQTDFNKCICCHQQLLSAASFIFGSVCSAAAMETSLFSFMFQSKFIYNIVYIIPLLFGPCRKLAQFLCFYHKAYLGNERLTEKKNSSKWLTALEKSLVGTGAQATGMTDNPLTAANKANS